MRKEIINETSCGALTWHVFDGVIKVLLIQQFIDKNQWSIPKGHMVADETHVECAIREVFEETGINIKLATKLSDVDVVYDNGKRKKKICSFLAQVADDQTNVMTIHDECEVADARWFDVNNLPSLQRSQENLIREGVVTILSATRH